MPGQCWKQHNMMRSQGWQTEQDCSGVHWQAPQGHDHRSWGGPLSRSVGETFHVDLNSPTNFPGSSAADPPVSLTWAHGCRQSTEGLHSAPPPTQGPDTSLWNNHNPMSHDDCSESVQTSVHPGTESKEDQMSRSLHSACRGRAGATHYASGLSHTPMRESAIQQGTDSSKSRGYVCQAEAPISAGTSSVSAIGYEGLSTAHVRLGCDGGECIGNQVRGLDSACFMDSADENIDGSNIRWCTQSRECTLRHYGSLLQRSFQMISPFSADSCMPFSMCSCQGMSQPAAENVIPVAMHARRQHMFLNMECLQSNSCSE